MSWDGCTLGQNIFFEFFDVLGSKSVRDRRVGVVGGQEWVEVGVHWVKIHF